MYSNKKVSIGAALHEYRGIETAACSKNFHWRGFIQWHMMVICIWCALFVTSQYDDIFMFINQRFGEVC